MTSNDVVAMLVKKVTQFDNVKKNSLEGSGHRRATDGRASSRSSTTTVHVWHDSSSNDRLDSTPRKKI